MSTFLLQRQQWLPTPLWLHFSILPPIPDQLRSGVLLRYRLRWHGVPVRWVTEITDWHPPHRFVDVQRRGPYRLWQHTHEFEAVNGGTRMRDSVHYALPWGVLGRLAHNLIVQRDLNTIFDYRSRHVSAWFDRQASTNSGPSSPSADASD